MVLFALTIVRHGETSYNKNGIIQGELSDAKSQSPELTGQSDIPLSSVGHDQAKFVARRLQKENFTHAISSDLSRAKETAEAIMKHNTASKCQLNFDERLRERKFGIYEGKPSKELMKVARKDSYHSWTEFNPPGGETVEELHNRAVTFFGDLCKELLDIKSMSAEESTLNKGKHLLESYSTSASTKTETKGNDRSFMLRKKTEAREIILPRGLDIDWTGVCSNHSTASDNFIVFEEDAVDEDCVNSTQIIETKELAPRNSTEESPILNTSGHTSTSSDQTKEKWQTMADILIVSHSGLIKELIKFFIEKLKCEIPNVGNGLRILHNCSVSKFLVSVPCREDTNSLPK
nr:fructose-2,6-bisphosphatase TIGAR B-like isoform X1 [Crassostrea virginica]